MGKKQLKLSMTEFSDLSFPISRGELCRYEIFFRKNLK
ncbi:Uncharacterized protein dnm_076940 [Desulfonema magnum]|uniref:Uncharacterized protein n=1 Tax=Desulfonema magnum TaxID=45655 RepID=A0A975BU99_9BACT|nr:Uncharacterized protein dnm_076940 [Desulfonema magnum]